MDWQLKQMEPIIDSKINKVGVCELNISFYPVLCITKGAGKAKDAALGGIRGEYLVECVYGL